MKNITLFIAFLMIPFFTGCVKDANQSNYDKSYSAWLSYKKSVNNSYIYVSGNESVFGGGVEIKTTVSNGLVIARDFTCYMFAPNTATKTIIKQWHEDKTSINTHGTEAGDILTLDDVYLRAKNVWLKADKKTNQVIFETVNNGLISSCGFVPNGCQDDCFNGIHISQITAL